jgi:5'-3' exonuclease
MAYMRIIGERSSEMARTLHLVDVSSAVYAGSVNTHAYISGPVINTASGYRERVIPMGGVSQLFNIVYKHLGTGTFAFCCDRAPTVKRGMLEVYKTTRTRNERVAMEKEIAEFVLNDCGFNVLAEEGYEADDLICTCTKRFKNSYDHVYVYTGDSDLYHLVSQNVSIMPTHSKAKNVTLENFEYTVKKDKHVKYNTITFQKVLDGDPSKAVKPLNSKLKQTLVQMFGSEFFQHKMGDKEFMRATVEAALPEVLPQFDIIYPLDAPVPDELFDTWDKSKIHGWSAKIRHKYIPWKQIDLSEQINGLLEKSLYI